MNHSREYLVELQREAELAVALAPDHRPLVVAVVAVVGEAVKAVAPELAYWARNARNAAVSLGRAFLVERHQPRMEILSEGSVMRHPVQ